MHTEIKIKMIDNDNVKFAHKNDFEYDVRASLENLFLIQGVQYEDIDFEFKYHLTGAEIMEAGEQYE